MSLIFSLSKKFMLVFALISTVQKFSERGSVLFNLEASRLNSIKNLKCFTHCFLLQRQSGSASFQLVCIKSLLTTVMLLPVAEWKRSAFLKVPCNIIPMGQLLVCPKTHLK